MSKSTKKVAEETKVIICDVEYSLNSSNKGLLKQVEGGKKQINGKREMQYYDYLPMNMVYRLMDGLFKSYDIISEPTKDNGEKFVVKKYDGSEEEVKVYGKTVEIITTDFDGNIRRVVGYAEGVAGAGILSKDNARNGFMRKLEARARKSALANLGQVFRIDAEFGVEEVVESAGLKEEATIEGVVAATTPATNSINPAQILKDKFSMQLAEKLAGKETDKAMLIAALKEIKAENNVVDGTVEHEVIKDLLNQFLPQLKK